MDVGLAERAFGNSSEGAIRVSSGEFQISGSSPAATTIRRRNVSGGFARIKRDRSLAFADLGYRPNSR